MIEFNYDSAMIEMKHAGTWKVHISASEDLSTHMTFKIIIVAPCTQ